MKSSEPTGLLNKVNKCVDKIPQKYETLRDAPRWPASQVPKMSASKLSSIDFLCYLKSFLQFNFSLIIYIFLLCILSSWIYYQWLL